MKRLAIMVALGLWPTVVPTGARAALPGTTSPGRAGEPGSGLAPDKPLRATDPERLRAPLPKRPRNDREARGVAEMEELLGRYRGAHQDMADTMADLLAIGVEQGKRQLNARYERAIKNHRGKARKLRAAAVKRYEQFLQAHPNDPTWTPEIMFRLADLHFEASSDRLTRQEDAYERALEAYQLALEKDPNAEAPMGPVADYKESIALFREVVTRFPSYPFNDAALYMIGTLLFEEENFDQSRQAYLALACRNRYEPPDVAGTNLTADQFDPGNYQHCEAWKEGSRFAAEAWLRVGEVHYDLDELDAALEAYTQVANDPENDLYDEALIRLAWTQYLKRDFGAAADTFDMFVMYADAQLGKGAAEGAVQLRDDGVKYLAKTYVEEDWDGDGRRDPYTGVSRLDKDYAGRNDEPHVPEVYAALGDLYAFQTDFQSAIQIWELSLRRWPLAPAAPSMQLRVLQAYNMLQDQDGATRARDALATNFLRGTQWFYANEGNPDVIEDAQKLAEEALVATAIDHHQKAQVLKADGDPGAKREYAIAAKAYAAYLERFPDTETSYEYRYWYADSLYYADQFIDAALQYAEVRDSNLDNRFQRDAAVGAVASWEDLIRQEETAGRMSVPDLPKKGSPGPFDQPKEIPNALLQLQAAYERFVDVNPDAEEVGTYMYLSGQVAQRYHHFDEAERRLGRVLEEHCDENVSINAAKTIIDGYVAREDLKKTQEWTEKLMEMKCGEGDESTKFAGELKSLKNAVRFQEATILYEAAEFEAAADRYVALVNEAPQDTNADRALNNAAVAYEKIGRYGSAVQTYKRIYTDYKDSEFADDALLRTGFNHIRFFEFDQAIKAYEVLAEDDQYKDSEFRETALWNAADLADNLRDYRHSATLYRKFAGMAADRDKAAEATFRAAEVTAKTGKKRATIRAFQDYLRRYGSVSEESARALEANLRIAHAYASMGKRKAASTGYTDVVGLFGARGLQPATEPADLAAEAQFQLAEYVMGDYLKVKLSSSGKRLEKETKDLLDQMVAAAKAYTEVVKYRRADWALAAVYRTGFAFEQTAIKLRAAPVPKKLKQYSEPWFAYKDIVDRAAQQFEAKAIGFYEQTLFRAKEYNIANEWTRAATERLNIYKPEEYPLLRPPALDLQLEDLR